MGSWPHRDGSETRHWDIQGSWVGTSVVLCASMRRGEGEWEQRKDRRRPSTSGTTWVTATTRTDRRWQMTTSVTVRHSQVTSRSTEHMSHESYLSQDRSDLKFASMQVCCAMTSPSVRDMQRVKRIGRYLAGKSTAVFLFRWQQRCELEAYSDTDWGGDRTTRRSMSAAVIIRGEHCLEEWTKKQQLMSWSNATSELYAAVKTASEGLDIQSLTKNLKIECKLNLFLDASATMCLVHRTDLDKAKHVNVQHLWIQEASKSEKLVIKKAGTHVKVPDLMTKLSLEPKMEQRLKLMGHRFVGIEIRTSKSWLMRMWWNHKLTIVVDGETQWNVADKVSMINSLQYGICVWQKDQKSKCFKDRQTRVRGRVLTCGSEASTAHDSCDFLTPLLVTLCDQLSLVCSQRLVVECWVLWPRSWSRWNNRQRIIQHCCVSVSLCLFCLVCLWCLDFRFYFDFEILLLLLLLRFYFYFLDFTFTFRFHF